MLRPVQASIKAVVNVEATDPADAVAKAAGAVNVAVVAEAKDAVVKAVVKEDNFRSKIDR